MLNKLVAEFLGTMFFLYVILATGDAVAIGLALMTVIFILGKVSGGHFNPAVSVMLAAAGKLSMKDLAPYVIAQVAGGLAALEIYKRVKF
jgi:aquaporin Z|tara:strand:- start:153 stop:422 length:270 start_codon:yes stop_codon:yes gene_type:complete